MGSLGKLEIVLTDGWIDETRLLEFKLGCLLLAFLHLIWFANHGRV